MSLEHSTPSQARRNAMFYTGWVLTLLPTLFIVTMVVVMLIFKPEMIQESVGKYGYSPTTGRILLVVELLSLALYLLPPTAVLGAVLLTGYLGGAVATHVRAGEPPIMPIVFGVTFWLGLFFRDARLRALLPWRRSSSLSSETKSLSI